MSDLTWDTWRAILSIAVAVIPAIVKWRAELAKAIDAMAEGIGLIVLFSGVVLYTHSFPQWEHLQDNLGPLAEETPILAAQQVQTLYTLYMGSIALMLLGGLLALSGLLGRARQRTPAGKRR